MKLRGPTIIRCACGGAVEADVARDWAEQLAASNREASMAHATVRKESATPISQHFRGGRFARAADGRVMFGAVPNELVVGERKPQQLERDGIAARGVGAMLSRAWAKLTARGGE